MRLLDHDGVVTCGGHSVDVEKTGLPYDEYVALLVRRGPHVVGHFLVTASEVTYPSREQRQVAVLLADQVAAALGARTPGQPVSAGGSCNDPKHED